MAHTISIAGSASVSVSYSIIKFDPIVFIQFLLVFLQLPEIEFEALFLQQFVFLQGGVIQQLKFIFFQHIIAEAGPLFGEIVRRR